MLLTALIIGPIKGIIHLVPLKVVAVVVVVVIVVAAACQLN